MAIGPVLNVTSDPLAVLVSQIGKIGLWLQAIGVFVILWVIFQGVRIIIARSRLNTSKSIDADLKRIESKVSSIERKMSSNNKTKLKKKSKAKAQKST